MYHFNSKLLLNNEFLAGFNTSGVSKRLIGVNSSNVVSIDPDALGAIFGSNVTATGNVRAQSADNSTRAVLQSNGNINLTGSLIDDVTGTNLRMNAANGVARFNNAAATDFSRLQFGGTTSAFPSIKREGAGLSSRLADDSAYGAFTAGTLTVSAARFKEAKGANVAAANDLTLGTDGNTFTITGNTQINAITTANWNAGSRVFLIFSGTPTVKHNTAGGGGTAVLLLQGSADLSAAANTVLGLLYDGTSWHEVSRKTA